jgi:hypothetical protein
MIILFMHMITSSIQYDVMCISVILVQMTHGSSRNIHFKNKPTG